MQNNLLRSRDSGRILESVLEKLNKSIFSNIMDMIMPQWSRKYKQSNYFDKM